MRLKLIVPVVMLATLALFAPHADAQTMGEYATATAGVGSGATSMGTSIGNSVSSNDVSGGSRTWGASSLGASFDDRAGAVSGAGLGASFEERAGASANGSTGESRWPAASQLTNSDSAGRFASSDDRFGTSDRFTERTDLSASGDRFPGSAFNDNKMGLDTNYNSVNGN